MQGGNGGCGKEVRNLVLAGGSGENEMKDAQNSDESSDILWFRGQKTV